MNNLLTTLKLTATTLLACCAAYPAALLAFARLAAPETAEGSLLRNGAGHVIGSRLIAQKFTRPAYFWPRPSAVDYHGVGAGGSNKSPTSRALTERAQALITQYGATPENPLPADLAAASGAGLDPHITLQAARFQAARVAAARDLAPARVEALIEQSAFSPCPPFSSTRLVNVLELNLALDGLK